MKTLVIIPTYNERENLEVVVRGVLESASDQTDLLIVDDASPDGTGQLADELSQRFGSRVSVLHRPSKSGLGSAYLEGFRLAVGRGYAAAAQMDADGSHHPDDLSRLIGAVREGAGLAIGSRRVLGGKIEGWGIGRHLMSWSAANVSRVVLRLPVRDASAGFRCLSRRACELLLSSPVDSFGFAFQEESLFWLVRGECRVHEVPVIFRNRTQGKSKACWREVANLVRALARLSILRHGKG